MKISEMISALEDIKTMDGDISVYVDITEDVPCGECGDLKHRVHDGFPKYVNAINLDGGRAAHIHAEVVDD